MDANPAQSQNSSTPCGFDDNLNARPALSSWRRTSSSVLSGVNNGAGPPFPRTQSVYPQCSGFHQNHGTSASSVPQLPSLRWNPFSIRVVRMSLPILLSRAWFSHNTCTLHLLFCCESGISLGGNGSGSRPDAFADNPDALPPPGRTCQRA